MYPLRTETQSPTHPQGKALTPLMIKLEVLNSAFKGKRFSVKEWGNRR